MCKCTPEIRTPFCGKDNCKWPDELEHPRAKKSLVERAKKFARNAHEGQLRDDGEDYFEAHILQVFDILSILTTDENILAAGLLHDTIEDTDVTYAELCDEFSAYIADLVMEITHEGEKDNYGRYFPRLHSQGGIMIKLADRASNVSQMDSWDDKRKAHYLKKTKFWKTTPNEEVKELIKKLTHTLAFSDGIEGA